MLLFLFFFVLWLLFNGRISWDVIGVGLILSAAVSFFAVKVCGWSSARSRRILKLSRPLLDYFAHLFVEIIKANLAVIRVILSPECRLAQPQVFSFDSRLHRRFAQTILANSITITPGTYTMGVQDGMLTVHALNGDFAEGTPGSDLNLRLIALEERLKNVEGGKT